MSLGSPLTSRFLIGAFDVRFGSLGLAGRLSPSQSIGISDRIGLVVSDVRVQRMTGEAQHSRPVRIGTSLSVKVSFRECSLRNLQAALGGDAVDAPIGSTGLFKGLLDTSSTVAEGATSLSFPEAGLANIGTPAVGGTITLSPQGDPGRASTHQVVSRNITGTAPNRVLVLGVQPGTAVAYQAGEAVEARQVRPLTMPGTDKAFSLRIVQKDRATAFPLVWDFWKVSLDADRSFDIATDEFFGGELAFKVEHPLASDLADASGLIPAGPLNHIAATIALNPLFRYAAIADLD